MVSVPFKIIKGGITAPQGFKAAGVHCGIKKKNKDLAIIYSEVPATTIGLFTSNKIKAPPILVDQKQLQKNNKIQAVVVNSGNANACTGERGIKDALKTIEITAKTLKINKNAVLVASTGKIGIFLPMEKIRKGIEKACSQMSKFGYRDAAEAILTTDTFKKEIAVEFNIREVPVRIGGIAKGSGMIHPGFATMLCFITTDVFIAPELLKKSINNAIISSFNSITIDGERSTNDTLLILANGMAENRKILSMNTECRKFQDALNYVCLELAKNIVRDGEGATKFVEVGVKGALNDIQARTAAFYIAESMLVKTALYGEDPNWGRIISAIGNAPIKLEPGKIDIFFNGVQVVKNNIPVVGGRERAKKVLCSKEIKISVDLNIRNGKWRVWTSDLSPGYVKINAAYT